MRLNINRFLIYTGIFIFLIVSCDEPVYKIYFGNLPVYMTYAELRSSISTGENDQIANPGKIYFKDNYIFIVDEHKGIHVFDNSNPAAPVRKTFIRIPGVIDLAISGSLLYADSYIDLIILDMQDIKDIHLVKRLEDVLPYAVPPADNDYPSARPDRGKGVVTGWETGMIKERDYEYLDPFPLYKDYDLSSGIRGSSGLSGSGTGTGGSMARFGIIDNALFLLTQSEVLIYDISTGINPVANGSRYTIWDSETLFLSGNYMFIGSVNGMVIFDITSRLNPVETGFFSHARSCDPVIVDDTLAFVTLRSGTLCGGAVNLLSVLNIKDIGSPKEIMTYSMTNPHGLAKEGDILFICDGVAGLKIYNASDPYAITDHLLRSYPGINAYDVIPLGGVLILVGKDGLQQYDYSDIQNITLLSTIPVDL